MINKLNFVKWHAVDAIAHNNFEFIIESNDLQEYRITQKNKLTGKHFARHSSCTVRVANQPDENLPLTLELSRIVLSQVKTHGDTECFIVALEKQALPELNPESIRHQDTKSELSYTATGGKLAYHWPVFKKYKETGYGSIIRATMTNHQVCSSNCQFCSTISRNKSDSVTLKEAIDFVDSLYYGQESFNAEKFPEYNALYKAETGSGIRLKGLILSGGGQPNLWPFFEEFVEYLSTLDIDLGLITNGFPTKVPDHVYDKFKWIRISVTPAEASAFYQNGDFRRQHFPVGLGMNGQTVGLSYVYGPWTDDAILERMDSFAKQMNFDYVRVLTDCNLTRQAQLHAHHSLSEKLLSIGLVDSAGFPTSKTFHQLKYHSTTAEAMEVWDDGQCNLQIYNAFWDTTEHDANGYSYIYPCDSVTVLSENSEKSSERKFNHEKWGTYKNTEVERLYTEKVRPFFDPRHECASCLFIKNNQTAKNLTLNPVKPQRPVDADHINFP